MELSRQTGLNFTNLFFNVYLGAITLAFALGISINQACADSLETLSDSELRQLVSRLQTEVNNLKQEVANLKAQIGSISSVQTYSGEFEVDGLWFSRSGQITSRPIRWEEKISTRYKDASFESLNTDTEYWQTYRYDEKGRFIGSSSNLTSEPQEYSITFEGKTKRTHSKMETSAISVITDITETYN